MNRPSTAQVDLLHYWRAIEMFSPQSVRPVSDANVVDVDLDRDRPLPWEPEGRPVGRPPQARHVRRYTVYIGVFDQKRVNPILEQWGSPPDPGYDERPDGETAVAACQVSDRGRLIAGSFVVSSCAWACGRCLTEPPTPSRLQGFDDVQTRARAHVAELLYADDPGHEDARVGRRFLREILRHLSAELDVEDCLSPAGLRIRATEVPEKAALETDTDFLNSFFFDDLALVADRMRQGDAGDALTTYLAPPTDGGRHDVRTDGTTITRGVRPHLVPSARWPADPGRSLVTHQQFAANHTMDSLRDRRGLVAVNGPPGTGKTTLLRDLIAEIVVERARRLADLRSPGDAFIDTRRYTTERGQFSVHLWRPELVGHEIVVASSNNGAVENVVDEIPAAGAAGDRWTAAVDHFADVATDVLRSGERLDAKEERTSTPTREAWALLAARLGNQKNRGAFASSFWFEPQTDDDRRERRSSGLKSILKEYEECGPPETWSAAVARFRDAAERIETLRAERAAAYDALQQIAALIQQEATLNAQLGEAVQSERSMSANADSAAGFLRHATAARDQAVAREATGAASRPGFWRPIRRRRWRSWMAELHQSRADAEGTYGAALERHYGAEARLTNARGQRVDVENRHHRVVRSRHRAQETITSARATWPHTVPGDHGPAPDQSPWLDEDWNDGRAELFLAALRLHKDFLHHAPRQMIHNLGAAVDAVKGSLPRDLAAPIRQAAWQSLFFAVPVVSTTFASFGRLFTGLDAEQLGWLFVDEAGQASPQEAAGALWRSRRAVVVGDPLQLEPVVSLSWKSREALREQHRVAREVTDGLPSVQRRTDERNTYGTQIGDVWVGIPLVVHRRCDEPMFGIVNNIAYKNMMINGVSGRGEFVTPDDQELTPSEWMFVPTAESSSEGHWLVAEGEWLEECLRRLHRRKQDMQQIILLGFFKDIAYNLDRISKKYGCLAGGTVHTSQGKESDIVFLVLGGDPSRAGALAWAAKQPNLLNVAASRARRRLYVVGDVDRWRGLPFFAQLASRVRLRSRSS